MFKRFGLLALFVIIQSGAQTYAEEYTVMTSNLSPFTIDGKGEKPGFLHEVVAEMSTRSKVNLQIKYVPWKRAQVVAKGTPNTLIFGITRTKKREPNYSWLVNLLNTEKVFISSSKPINSFAEAKQTKHIAVRAATPYERQLKAEGFNNLISVQREKQNADLLKKGRAEAWMTLSHRAAYVWQSAGYDIKELKVGQALSKSQLFLAGHPSLAGNTALKDKLQKAYNSIVADGTFNKLHMKYFGSDAK